MKFTNVKQLIIKFMGGGLINFPTRFLRWVKINGDSDDSDGGGGSDRDVFFAPATIQPKYFVNDNGTEPIEIENYTSATMGTTLFYNKEDIINLGVNEEDLNNLNIIGIDDAFNDFYGNRDNAYIIQSSAFNGKTILSDISMIESTVKIYNSLNNGYLYKISNDLFLILQKSANIEPI